MGPSAVAAAGCAAAGHPADSQQHVLCNKSPVSASKLLCRMQVKDMITSKQHFMCRAAAAASAAAGH